MMIFGLLFLLALAESTSWYATYGLSEQESEYLKEKRCFRGTYGLDDLSLLNCPFGESHYITELPTNTPVCVVELAHANDERAVEIATHSGEATVIFNARRMLVLAAKDVSAVDYPSVCLSSSDYQGSALNVIPVPSHPFLPIERHPSPAVSAPNPKITALLNAVTAANLQATITWLSNFNSRQSLSTTAAQAVNAVQTNFTDAKFTTTQQSINRTGYCNNVVAIKTGTVNPNNYVVVGAHLDDRTVNISSTTARAPGADDNGSGSAAVLELAKLINSQNLTFQNTLVLTLFCGEEQGLYGSDFQAKDFKTKTNIRILAMYNADMLGYNCGTTTLGLVNRSADVPTTTECRNVIAEYFPTLRTGSTSACCSDQQSYFSQGYPAVGFFECTGTSVTYPQYHTSNDLPQYLDFNQVAAFSKAVFACALTKAVPN